MAMTLAQQIRSKMRAKKNSRKHVIHEAQELRKHLSEKQIDKMLADSFPASDPPSTY